MVRNENGFTITEIILAIGIASFMTLLISASLTGFVNLRRLTETEVSVSDYIYSISSWLRSPKTFNIPGFDPNYNPASSCTYTFYGASLPTEDTAGVWNGINISIPVNTGSTSWKYSGHGAVNTSGSNNLANGVQLSRDIRIANGDGLQARFRKSTFVSQGDQLLKPDYNTRTTRRVLQVRLKLEVQSADSAGTLAYRRPTREIFFETLVETIGTIIYACIPEVSLREACKIQQGTYDEGLRTCTPNAFCENAGYFIAYTCSSGTMGTAPCNKFVLQGNATKANNPFTGAQSCPPGTTPTKISEADVLDGYKEEYYSCMRCN